MSCGVHIGSGIADAWLLANGTKKSGAAFITTSLDYDPASSQEIISDATNVRVYQNWLAQTTDSGYTNPKDFTTVIGSFADFNNTTGNYAQSVRNQLYDPTDGFYEIYDWVSNNTAFDYFAEMYLYTDEGINPFTGAYLASGGVGSNGDYNSDLTVDETIQLNLNGTDSNGAFLSAFVSENGTGTEATLFTRIGIDSDTDAYNSQVAINETSTYISRNGLALNGNAYTSTFTNGKGNTFFRRSGTNGNGAWIATFQTGGNNGTITQINRVGFDPAGRSLGMNMIMNEDERTAFQRREETAVASGIFREQDFGFYGTSSSFGQRTSRFYHVHANGTDLNQMQIQDAEYKIKYRENNTTLERSIVMTDSLFELERWKSGTNVKLALVDAGTILTGGDAEIVGSSNGLILESPDNTRWRVTIDNTGNLTTATV